MTSFRFPLDRVLAWRRTQLEIEQENYRRQADILAALDRRAAELVESGNAAEHQVRVWVPVSGSDLEALNEFRRHVRARELEMAVPRREAQQRLAAQRAVVLEARRRVRLLEKLRDRRAAEWNQANARELDQVAAESYLSRWASRE